MIIGSYEAIYGVPVSADQPPLGPISSNPKLPNTKPKLIPKNTPNQAEVKVTRIPPITAKKSAPPMSSKWRHPASNMFKYQPPYGR